MDKINSYTVLLLFILIIILLSGVIDTMKSPLYERDGLDIWLTKAKMIYLDKTIYSDNFFNPHRIQDHPKYPLFLPLLEASYFQLCGVDERRIKILFIFIWMLILGVVFEGLLRSKKGLNYSLFSLAILSTIPAYYVMPDGSLSTGYADIPLSLFYLSFFVSIYEYFRTKERKFVILAGIFTAFSMFTKNEGIVFAISIFIIFIFFLKKKRDIQWFSLCAILPILPWLILRAYLPDLFTEHYLSHFSELFSHFSRIFVVLKNALLEVFNPKHWGIFWIIAMYFFVKRGNNQSLSVMKFIIIIILIFYLSIFLITPWDISLQMKIVFPRMLLHLTPSLVFLMFLS